MRWGASMGASKKSRVAKERDEVGVKEARRAFGQTVAQVPLDKLVFLDECGFSLNLHRLYGWTIGGGRLLESVPLNNGRNRSVVGAYGWPCALNPTGLWALWQRQGAWNSPLFTLFVEEAVLPLLPKGSVLVPLQRANPSRCGFERGRRRGGMHAVVLATLLARLQPHRDAVELAQASRAKPRSTRR